MSYIISGINLIEQCLNDIKGNGQMNTSANGQIRPLNCLDLDKVHYALYKV